MSFTITESKSVNHVDASGNVVGSSTVDVELTLKVSQVVLMEDSTTAHVHSSSSSVSSGDLEGSAIWSFYGSYPVVLDANSAVSMIDQAEAQVKTQLTAQ